MAHYFAESPTFGYEFDPPFILRYLNQNGEFDIEIKRLLEMGVYSEADIHGEGRIGDAKLRSKLLNVARIAELCISEIDCDRFDEHHLNRLEQQSDWPSGWLVREIFGNPFRETPFNPDWRTETVLDIAQGAYEERAFERLAVLSDALVDAGCDEGELLEHLRSEGPHFKGCWALDKVLGL